MTRDPSNFVLRGSSDDLKTSREEREEILEGSLLGAQLRVESDPAYSAALEAASLVSVAFAACFSFKDMLFIIGSMWCRCTKCG